MKGAERVIFKNAVQGERPKRIFHLRIHEGDLGGVAHKYGQLVRGIEAMPAGDPHKGALLNDAMKLGCFLSDLFGYVDGNNVWRTVTLKEAT